jgi:hypothetical protein
MSGITNVMPGPVELSDAAIDAVTGGVNTEGCVIGTNGQTALTTQAGFSSGFFPLQTALTGLSKAGAGSGCTCILTEALGGPACP